MIDVPILVKDALRDGRLKKNFRILVLNDDGTTDFVIDNDTLVSESVDIDERMCSGDTIKFGLCEGSSIEFQYFNHPNIYGRKIQIFVDIWSDYVSEYETKWHDVTTLNGDNWKYTIDNAGEYKLEWPRAMQFRIVWTNSGTIHSYDVFIDDEDWFKSLGNMVEGDTIETFSRDNYSASLKGYYETPASYWYSIPMGFFTVEKCSRQASTGIKKVTAYNKLQSAYLDADAKDILIETFGNNSVEIIDILRWLLDDYGIESNRDYISPHYYDYYNYYDDASVSFSPFKYSSLKGDQGIFSPYILKYGNSSFSTSTNTYINGAVHFVQFNIESQYYNRYVQIDINDKAIDADANIANFIKSQLNMINSSTSGDVLWSRFQDMVGSQYQPVPGQTVWNGYFFNVTVVYGDQSVEVYGDNVKNADGTFDELRKKTLYDVRNVYVMIPTRVEFGTGFYADGSINPLYADGQGAQNGIDILSSGSYGYYDNNNNVVIKQYTAPRYSDNTNIYYSDLKKYFSVSVVLDEVSDIETVTLNPTNINDVTLRELQSAVFETVCQFGKLDRVTDLFSGVELNHSRLYPATTLYPDTALYPDGAALSSEKSMYSKLWADEGNVQKWRNLIITYKGLDENNQEKDFTLERVVNSDGTQDYNMSDNWLFKNLVWTASDVGDYADVMVSKMRDVTWFPFEMWCAGLPYIETGDELEISIGEETYTSYVLQRQLKGIQNLQDTFINGILDIF